LSRTRMFVPLSAVYRYSASIIKPKRRVRHLRKMSRKPIG
jgi:hypothetical protein